MQEFYTGLVETFACPNHSCTLAISALFESAFVAAAVAHSECRYNPTTWALISVACAYLRTMLR